MRADDFRQAGDRLEATSVAVVLPTRSVTPLHHANAVSTWSFSLLIAQAIVGCRPPCFRERFPSDCACASSARKRPGGMTPESDIDLFVAHLALLCRGVSATPSRDALFDIEMEFDVVISTLVASEEDWLHGPYQVLAIRDEVERDGSRRVTIDQGTLGGDRLLARQGLGRGPCLRRSRSSGAGRYCLRCQSRLLRLLLRAQRSSARRRAQVRQALRREGRAPSRRPHPQWAAGAFMGLASTTASIENRHPLGALSGPRRLRGALHVQRATPRRPRTLVMQMREAGLKTRGLGGSLTDHAASQPAAPGVD